MVGSAGVLALDHFLNDRAYSSVWISRSARHHFWYLPKSVYPPCSRMLSCVCRPAKNGGNGKEMVVARTHGLWSCIFNSYFLVFLHLERQELLTLIRPPLVNR